MINIGPHDFTQQDARGTMKMLGDLWKGFVRSAERGGPDTTVTALGDALATRLGTAIGAPPHTSLAALGRRFATATDDRVLEGALRDVWQTMDDAAHTLRRDGLLPRTCSGTVVQLNTSAGGVPKRCVDAVEVGFGGIVGDVQKARVHHGRPWQALCLYGDEMIDALRSEGHPIARGSAGENITVAGIPWPDVVPGVRLRIGSVLADVQSYTEPCRKIAPFFVDGDFRRMHIDRGPMSRVYATVIEPGRIETGDAVVLEPTTVGSSPTQRLSRS